LKSSENPKLLQNSEIIDENIPSFFEDIVEDVKFVGEAILFLQSEGEDVKETIDLIKKNWFICVENYYQNSLQNSNDEKITTLVEEIKTFQAEIVQLNLDIEKNKEELKKAQEKDSTEEETTE
jgi:hypothetical protein